MRHFLRGAAKWLLLAACLAAVAMPRFNLRDPGIIGRFTTSATATPYGLPIDVEGYVRLVRYYRSEAPADSMMSPYCYRPLVPYLASFIPTSALTAINLLDLIASFLTVIVINLLLRHFGVGNRSRTFAALLFIVSFPTFYYTTIGFIDPVAILWVALLLYLTSRNRFWLAAICSVLAVLTKETNLVFTVLPGLSLWMAHRREARYWIPAVLAPPISAGAALATRGLTHFPEQGFFWNMHLHSLVENLSRPRVYLSLALTLGIPTALAIAAILRGRPEQLYGRTNTKLLLCGCALACSLYAYSLMAAYADGRVIWVIYPFAIPLAVSLVRPVVRESGVR
jgi:hypothetical protein